MRLLLFLLVASTCAAQPARPTPTPKEKIVHPSAVIFPTSVRRQEEELKLKFEKISLVDAVDFLEKQTGEPHVLALQRPAAGILLDLAIYGPKTRALLQMRAAIETQAAVRFVRMGALWNVIERDLPPANPPPETENTPVRRPRPTLQLTPSPTPTPTR